MMTLIAPAGQSPRAFSCPPPAVTGEPGLPDISVITRGIRGRRAPESRRRRWSILRQTRPARPEAGDPAGEQAPSHRVWTLSVCGDPLLDHGRDAGAPLAAV